MQLGTTGMTSEAGLVTWAMGVVLLCFEEGRDKEHKSTLENLEPCSPAYSAVSQYFHEAVCIPNPNFILTLLERYSLVYAFLQQPENEIAGVSFQSRVLSVWG